VSAAQVKPSPEGVPGALLDPATIDAQEITYMGAGATEIAGYLARPSSPHPAGALSRLPGMIVIHEAGGLGEHIRDVTNRIANLGYVALAPDLYTREGGPPPAGDLEALFERLFSMPDERVLGDLEGAAEQLAARPDQSGRIGCIGFCMGGRYTLLYACTRQRLNAAVDCWGGFVDTATPDERATATRPIPPLELAEQLGCPLLAAVGAEDHNPSPEVGERLRARAARSTQPVRVDVYEGAGHAFFADYRPSYRQRPAALLWERLVPFLAEHLGGHDGA
jgi:carboxymethylenebutenolidase